MALVEQNGILGKVCSKCKEWKPVERFSQRKASRDGYNSLCKPCNSTPNTIRQPIEIDGKVCTMCNEWKPASEYYRKRYSVDGYRSACKECFQASNKNRRYLDIETSRAKERERYARTRPRRIEMRRIRIAARLEEHQAYMRTWRQANRDKMRGYSRESREKDPEKAREANRRSYRKHREKSLAKKNAYAKANRNLRLSIAHRYRARKKANGGSFTPQEWQDLKEHYNFTCLCCGKREPDILLVVDHVIPISRGGSNDINNIQPLCWSCNASKWAKSTDYRPAARARLGLGEE